MGSLRAGLVERLQLPATVAEGYWKAPGSLPRRFQVPVLGTSFGTQNGDLGEVFLAKQTIRPPRGCQNWYPKLEPKRDHKLGSGASTELDFSGFERSDLASQRMRATGVIMPGIYKPDIPYGSMT